MPARKLISRKRRGFSLRSQFQHRLNGAANDDPRFTGVSLRSPDRQLAWNLVYEVASGEYDIEGFRPRPGMRVIDIGANVGVFSLWATWLGAHVVAYEPEPNVFSCLVENVSGRDATPYQAAVVGTVPESGRIELFRDENRNTRNTILGRDIETGSDLKDRDEVPAIGIDEVLGGGCDLIKIDCEGAEFEIFEKASDEALRRADRILLEFHRSVGDPQDLVSRLSESGFEARIRSESEDEDEDDPFGIILASRR